jgi:hypothetical protein
MDLHGEIYRELERDEELITSMESDGEDRGKNSKTSMGPDSKLPNAQESNEPPDPGRYRVENGRICIEKTTREGEILTLPLCEFTARVTEELVLDNGADTTRAFILSGALATGQPLPTARVPVSRFAGMSWITEQWGSRAINAGLSVRDQLREAIQRLSSPPRVRRVFTHTGWHEAQGEWVFLTSSGAVGRDGYEVDLGTDLTRYSLPRIPKDPVEAMQHSLRLLEIAPLTVTVPLLAAVFRAPLASVLPLDLSLWLEGFTGSLKSTIAALLLSHFGDFTETSSLPGSWLSTVNQLERRAFVLKDVPFVIDDYAPSGADARELESKASRLLRSQGNLASRGRLRSDLSERPGFPPRGIIIGTGEQHPPGQSILARTLLIELERSTVDLLKLSQAQNNASRLPHAMAGYLLWLGNQMVQLPSLVKESFAAARASSVSHDGHLRIPSTLANLWLGIECALQYAEEVGSITNLESETLRSRCWAALGDVGTKQVLSVEAERPSRRFLRVLAALVGQGRASLLRKECVAHGNTGNAAFVGWQDEEFIYLVPDAAFQSVARFCREAGEYFPVRSERLWRDLNQEGVSECAEGRHSTTATIGGQKRRVAKLFRERVENLIGEAWPRSTSLGTIGTDGTGSER